MMPRERSQTEKWVSSLIIRQPQSGLVALGILFAVWAGLYPQTWAVTPRTTPPPAAQPNSTATPNAPAKKEVAPLVLTIQPVKNIYRKREGIQMSFVMKAQQPLRLCLEKDPLSQFQFSAFKGGQGAFPLEPYVTKDTRELYFEKIRIVELKAGQQFPFRANIKKLVPGNGAAWDPGDYTMTATFNLCDQTTAYRNDSAGRDTPIKAGNLARFMITD